MSFTPEKTTIQVPLHSFVGLKKIISCILFIPTIVEGFESSVLFVYFFRLLE